MKSKILLPLLIILYLFSMWKFKTNSTLITGGYIIILILFYYRTFLYRINDKNEKKKILIYSVTLLIIGIIGYFI